MEINHALRQDRIPSAACDNRAWGPAAGVPVGLNQLTPAVLAGPHSLPAQCSCRTTAAATCCRLTCLSPPRSAQALGSAAIEFGSFCIGAGVDSLCFLQPDNAVSTSTATSKAQTVILRFAVRIAIPLPPKQGLYYSMWTHQPVFHCAIDTMFFRSPSGPGGQWDSHQAR